MGLYQNEEQLNVAFAVDRQKKKHPPRGGAFQNYRAAKKFIEVACFSKKDIICIGNYNIEMYI